MIADTGKKIKHWIGESRSDILVSLIILTISVASFGLGRLSAIWAPHSRVEVRNPDGSAVGGIYQQNTFVTLKGITSSSTLKAVAGEGSIVASKNGTAYHLTTCSGAKQIKVENRIYFMSAEEAKRAGYRPAANCPGLAK